MRKKLLVTLFLLILPTFFFSLKLNAKQETIRVWVGAISQEKDEMVRIGQQFKQETGIAVEVIQKLEIFTVPDALVNNAELDSRPDIVYMQAPDIGGLVRSGFLEPLELTEATKERYVDVAVDAFTLDGKTYGIGYSNSTSGLLYNKDLVSEAELPETWDEFFLLAENLTIKDECGTIRQRGAYFNATDMWFNYPLIRHYGGYYYGFENGSYDPFDIGLANAGMLNYIDQMKRMQQLGLIIDNREKKDYSPIIADFSDGKVAMFLYGLWSAAIFKNKGINYGIAPLPYSGDTRSKPLTTVEGFVINKFSKNMDNAKLFYNYIYRDDNQQRLIEAGNKHALKTGERNPCNISVIDSEYIQSDEILNCVCKIGFDVEPFPNISEGPLWYNQNVTFVTLAQIFFGDPYGNKVDAEFKLNELTSFLLKEVANMNQETEPLDISKALYIIIGCAVLAVVLSVIIVVSLLKKKKADHLKPINDTKESIVGYLLLLPFFALVILFYIYPIVQNFSLSMTNYSGTNLRDYTFIGFSNYKTIFTNELKGLLGMTVWTLVFAIVVTGGSFIFGTLLASLLETVNSKISRIYRIIYILPWVIPTAITLLMWQGLLETQGGLINQLLGIFGIKNIPWLTNPYVAKFSTIFVMTWFSFPYYMVIAFGFLKSISKDYYEAAKIDGATKMQKFRKITLPLTFYALIPMLIMGFLMQFNQFGVYLLTQGGPAASTIGAPGATDLLVTYIFNTSFNTKRYGIAAAYAVIVFMFMALFSLVLMRINKRREGN